MNMRLHMKGFSMSYPYHHYMVLHNYDAFCDVLGFNFHTSEVTISESLGNIMFYRVGMVESTPLCIIIKEGLFSCNECVECR